MNSLSRTSSSPRADAAIFASLRRSTAPPTEESTSSGSRRRAKCLLEDRLKGASVDRSAALPLKSNIVVDRDVYTGLNPCSSAACASRMIADVSATQWRLISPNLLNFGPKPEGSPELMFLGTATTRHRH